MQPLTVTHARIRAAQGDLEGARRILDAILAEKPDHDAARALRASLGGRSGAERPDPTAPELEAPVGGDAQRLAARFRRALGRAAERDPGRRIRRLERWLALVSRGGSGGLARTGRRAERALVPPRSAV